MPDNALSHVVEALLSIGNFEAETTNSAGEPRMWFKAPNGKNYNVNIIEPRKLHSTVKFSSDSATSQDKGTMAKVMLPAKLLNLKILAYNTPEESD